MIFFQVMHILLLKMILQQEMVFYKDLELQGNYLMNKFLLMKKDKKLQVMILFRY